MVVSDEEVDEVMRELKGLGLRSGACGAASIVGARKRQGWTNTDVVVLISSEGQVRELLGF